MTYRIEFIAPALKEFQKLNPEIQRQFAQKLKERAESPRVESSKLRGMKDCYKIKLRSIGYRLVYKVIDEKIVVKVISVGRRDRNDAYRAASLRV